MFVHPEPGRRVPSNVRLERIPARLRDLLMIHPSRVLDLRMNDNPVTSARQRFAMRWNNGRPGLLVQPGMRRSHTRLQPKAFDGHRALSRRHGKIDQQSRASFSAERFVKADDAAFTRDRHVSGLFPDLLKNCVQRRVLEFLRNDGGEKSQEAADQTEPLEIAVVVTRDYHVSFRAARPLGLVKVLHLDVAGKVFRGEPRTPQKVEHRSREMLIGLPNDSLSLQDRQLITERSLEITQSNTPALSIQY